MEYNYDTDDYEETEDIAPEPVLSDEEKQLRKNRIFEYLAGAAKQQTSRPSDIAFYAFTGEKLPGEQRTPNITTPMDIEAKELDALEKKTKIADYIRKSKEQPKQQQEWEPLTGKVSKSGKPIFYNKFTKEMIEGDIELMPEKPKAESMADLRPFDYMDDLGNTRQGLLNSKTGQRIQNEKDPVLKKPEKTATQKKADMSYDERLAGLTADQRTRFDNASLALKSVEDMANALASGSSTFSLVGDNEYTMARTMFEEGLGRMQSGGAITDDEADRFKGMAPKLTDSADIRRKKLQELMAEMGSRVKNLGFDPNETLMRKKAARSDVQLPMSTEGKAVALPGRAIVSNGKETLEIDESDVPAAEKDGYKRIK